VFVVEVLGEESRKIQVSVGKDEVVNESEGKEDTKDKFKLVISAMSEGLKLDIESQFEDKDQDFKDQRRFTIYFGSIVQYDTGGAYTGGATVGTAYSLGKTATWNDFSCPQDGDKYVCTVRTTDGVFTATFEFSGEAFSSSGLQLTPDDLKITVDINNFPYANNNNNLRLALNVYGWAKVEYIDKSQSGENKMVNTGGAAFQWVDTATVDGASTTVAASPVEFTEDGSGKKFNVWFSFLADRPNSINWDPVLSINAGAVLLINYLLLLFATVIVMTLVL
jgi:hypothetical protein